jgi:hypothetical protein
MTRQPWYQSAVRPRLQRLEDRNAPGSLRGVAAEADDDAAAPLTKKDDDDASALSLMGPTARGGRAAATGTVFVTSQGLYYDTFVAVDPLPMHGPFQQLENGQTEFGPGDPGYLGGRWWEDLNSNNVQDAGDHYFLCPLLGPGRPTP